MLQRTRLVAMRQRAALVTRRAATAACNEQLSHIHATSSPRGTVGTAVGKASAAAAWRGGGLVGVARHLSSEAAGSVAALPNADSLEKGFKDVLGEKLASMVEVADVLSDPLMAQTVVTLLHRVRMQCGAVLRVLWCCFCMHFQLLLCAGGCRA